MTAHIEAELDIVCGNRRAIMPTDAVAQSNLTGAEVPRLLPALRQQPFQLATRIQLEQRQEHHELGWCVVVRSQQVLVSWIQDGNGIGSRFLALLDTTAGCASHSAQPGQACRTIYPLPS